MRAAARRAGRVYGRAVTRLRTRHGVAVGAAATALLLAGCGTTVSGQLAQTSDAVSQGGLGAAPVGSAATPGSAAAAGGGSAALAPASGGGAVAAPGSSVGGSTSGGSAVAGGGGAPPPVVTPGLTGDHQGVTATTIRIGFIGIDQASETETNAALGTATPPANTQDAVNAIVKYVNAHGGIAGRKVVPYYVERKTTSTDANSDVSLCTKLTEDDHVFAVVTNSTGDNDDCYAKHHTLLLNDTLLPERADTTKYSPYIWSPGPPSVEAGYASMVDSLGALNFFAAPAKVGILLIDDPGQVDVYKRVVQPALAAHGVRGYETFHLAVPETTSDNAQYTQQIQAAVLQFKAHGVNRVMFMAPGGEAPLVFMENAETQVYHPTYGVSSYDSPAFLLQGKAPSDQLHGTVGAGFLQLTDVDATHGTPFPSGPAETRCKSILDTTGNPPATRAAAFAGEYLCDGAFMLQAAGLRLGADISVQAWAAAADKLGTAFQANYSLPDGTFFGPGVRSGGRYYRELKYVDGCGCFQYVGGNRPTPPA